jgi:rhodanese-related sulfurtransferase
VKRRTLLGAIAGSGAGAAAGCLSQAGQGGQSGGEANDSSTAPYDHPGTLEIAFTANGDYPADEDPSDGFPPEFPSPPPAPDVDESTFETLDVNGESVKLAPIDVVEAWYRRAETRVVDARGLDQYKRAHVYGGVSSTAQRGSEGGAIDDWPTDTRIVTYCRCPHHLSSIRAAGLQKAGYERVYALDEGFGAWIDREYPMAGTKFGDGNAGDISEWTLEGDVDPRYAGEYAWASIGKQYEAAPIDREGRFELVLRFAGVTADTRVRVSTPAFTATRPLRELAAGTLGA